jgi:hypothetical protein
MKEQLSEKMKCNICIINTENLIKLLLFYAKLMIIVKFSRRSSRPNGAALRSI